MKPDLGFASYDAFQGSLAPETRERYWALTNKLLAIKEKFGLEKDSIKLMHAQLGESFDIRGAREANRKYREGEVSAVMEELYQKAEGVNESTEPPSSRERESLALSIILAKANVSPGLSYYMAGVNIRVYRYGSEGYHPYSRNQLEIDVPNPNPESDPVTIPTNLARMREHLKLATTDDRVTSQTVGYELLSGKKAAIVEDTADVFVLRTAREILDVQEARGKNLSKAEIYELRDIHTCLSADIIGFWSKGKIGRFTGLSDVSISLGYKNRRRPTPDQIVIRISSGTLERPIEINTLSPWNLQDWTDDQKRIVNMLRDARQEYDFIVGKD